MSEIFLHVEKHWWAVIHHLRREGKELERYLAGQGSPILIFKEILITGNWSWFLTNWEIMIMGHWQKLPWIFSNSFPSLLMWKPAHCIILQIGLSGPDHELKPLTNFCLKQFIADFFPLMLHSFFEYSENLVLGLLLTVHWGEDSFPVGQS